MDAYSHSNPDEVAFGEAWRDHHHRARLGALRRQRPDGCRVMAAPQAASDNRAPLTPAPEEPVIEIFDAEKLALRLGDREGFIGESGGDEDAAQARQARLWARMRDDERGPWRRLVIADEAMIARLAGLDTICPHFSEVTSWVVRAATLSRVTGTPLRLDPAVVLGPPGVGKTFYARKLAEALGVPHDVIAMNLMTDRGSAFSGLTPVWKASGAGKVAKLLVEGTHACPLIVVDEIEKASPLNPSETPVNVLHSLLERENAARFVDEFIDLPLRADHIFWFATANSLDPLPMSIVDRLIVFTVEPKPEQMLAIQASIFREANLQVGQSFAVPEETLLRMGAGHNPRLLARLWPLAMGFACEAGRRHLVAADVHSAEQVLISGKESARAPIGFIRSTRGAKEQREHERGMR